MMPSGFRIFKDVMTENLRHLFSDHRSQREVREGASVGSRISGDLEKALG